MASLILGVASLYLFIALVGYAVTLSGIEITYIVPLEVRTEVGIGLVAVALALLAVVGAVTAVVMQILVPEWAAWLIAGGVAVAAAPPAWQLGRRRFELDVRRVTARRSGRRSRR